MLPHAYRLIRMAITAGLLIVAAIVTVVLWDYYTASPWTRNGQVRTQVANIAPRVSGQILEVNVHDNQYVRKGDVLYVIDPFDFHVQLDVARANVAQRKAEMEFRIAQAERRRLIPGIAVSREEKQQFEAEAAQAKAMYEGAAAAERQAAINLDRSTVHSPINGWVTNLIMRPGDFATAGHVNIQIIDSEAFWVDGYFEETKVHGITEGDPVRVDLMGFHTPLMGHVESITRGIASRNAATSTQGLPLVDPVYTWVRLAQRIPVRVHLDEVPPGLVLSAGMTATVTIVTEEGKRRHLSTRDAIKHMGYDLRRATGHW